MWGKSAQKWGNSSGLRCSPAIEPRRSGPCPSGQRSRCGPCASNEPRGTSCGPRIGPDQPCARWHRPAGRARDTGGVPCLADRPPTPRHRVRGRAVGVHKSGAKVHKCGESLRVGGPATATGGRACVGRVPGRASVGATTVTARRPLSMALVVRAKKSAKKTPPATARARRAAVGGVCRRWLACASSGPPSRALGLWRRARLPSLSGRVLGVGRTLCAPALRAGASRSPASLSSVPRAAVTSRRAKKRTKERRPAARRLPHTLACVRVAARAGRSRFFVVCP